MSTVSGLPADLRSAAEDWLAEDPDPDTRKELAKLLASGDEAELRDRFAGRLEFGTAGLRGALGAGPNRMNRVVVMRAAAGLAAHVKTHGGGAVVIGYDARHKSDVFAHDTAAVMAGAGLAAMVLPRPLPTPVLAFAIRHLGCAAGVMVTASHNPPQDNGYKVYLGEGSQIVPPADSEISAEIDKVGPLSTIPLGDEWVTLDDEVLDAYVSRTSSLVREDVPRDLNVVYSAMHGVGGSVVLRTVQDAGFPEPTRVAEQFNPDPDFPTVAFPNPEEPGAIDLALAAAARHGADLVIANDPDADRCAVAVATRDGSWRMLRGDEVGVMLGVHVLQRGTRGTFANSIVSSSLLGKIAAKHGVDHEETLTGFKWIARVPGLAYGYEEALGYCVDPAAVRDKDGISAALLICELASLLKSQGRSLLDLLDDVMREYGLHSTDQLSVRVDDLSLIARAMDRLRAAPPKSLGGLLVLSIDDLERGDGGLPPTDGLRYRLESGARVIVRPSGTEPKLKCYLEVVVPVDPTGNVDAARAVASRQHEALKRDLAAALGLG